MTHTDLREELERIAAGAPVADVPTDTFARGRRARLRSLVVAGAAGLAVVALVAAAALRLPHDDRVPVATDGSTLGVPSRLYAVPGSARAERESDLAIGVAAVAWLGDQGEVVVVDAASGAYHLLNLPDGPDAISLVLSSFSGTAPLALSPDGTHLAYATGTGTGTGTGGGPDRAGIAVLDLVTGDVVATPLQELAGVEVTRISWSPRSEWIFWEGHAWGRWDDTGQSGGTAVAGRVRPDRPGSQQLPVPRATNHTTAIADDGSVVMITGSTVRRLTPGTRGELLTRPRLGPLAGTAHLDRSGTHVVTGVGSDGTIGRIPDGSLGTVISLARPAGVDTLPAASGPRATDDTHALGWVGDTALVARTSADGRGTDVLLAPPSGPAIRVTGSTEYGVPTTLTIAVDLMTLERPTVDRPAPDWPWTTARKLVTSACGLAATAFGLMALLVWRRRRRRLT